MTHDTPTNRQPRGIPIGGQFAGRQREEADVSELGSDRPSHNPDREAALTGDPYRRGERFEAENPFLPGGGEEEGDDGRSAFHFEEGGVPDPTGIIPRTIEDLDLANPMLDEHYEMEDDGLADVVLASAFDLQLDVTDTGAKARLGAPAVEEPMVYAAGLVARLEKAYEEADDETKRRVDRKQKKICQAAFKFAIAGGLESPVGMGRHGYTAWKYRDYVSWKEDAAAAARLEEFGQGLSATKGVGRHYLSLVKEYNAQQRTENKVSFVAVVKAAIQARANDGTTDYTALAEQVKNKTRGIALNTREGLADTAEDAKRQAKGFRNRFR